MSTEQNTQPVLHKCLVCKELGATVFHGFVTHRTEDWRHPDCFPDATPQTEAVEVDFKSLAYNFEFGYRNRTDDYVENSIRKIYRDAREPLTARIRQLEQV